MGTTSPFFKDHNQPHHSLSFAKKILPCLIYAIFPIAIFRLYFYPLSLPDHQPTTTHFITSSSSSPSPQEEEIEADQNYYYHQTPCDYTDGSWVHDDSGPLYNGSTCGTIKQGQNCISHGRPDLGYLNWRWRPNQCNISRFQPNTFLHLLNNKHLAFVGDSMARNQLESLLCLLATASPPNLVYTSGEDNKFRRWHFPTHNLNVSVYWSPFLVKGVEKSNNGDGPRLNRLYVDTVDERWAADLGNIDFLVLSVGHWFLHQAVFFEGNSVLGCHSCAELGFNHTQIEFYDALRKALRTTLGAVVDRRGSEGPTGRGIDVVVTTFSPAHFEGEWDNVGACSKTEPVKKALEGMDAEMRKIEVEEVERARVSAKLLELGSKLRVEALDVTKLSLMRPDGHPGPYMHPFPFANGVPERVQNDCVHWCLPGPIDTWNEILLEVMRRWHAQSRREVTDHHEP